MTPSRKFSKFVFSHSWFELLSINPEKNQNTGPEVTPSSEQSNWILLDVLRAVNFSVRTVYFCYGFTLSAYLTDPRPTNRTRSQSQSRTTVVYQAKWKMSNRTSDRWPPAALRRQEVRSPNLVIPHKPCSLKPSQLPYYRLLLEKNYTISQKTVKSTSRTV